MLKCQIDSVPLYHCTISKIDLASQPSIILSYILYYNIIYKININTPQFPNDCANQIPNGTMVHWYIGTVSFVSHYLLFRDKMTIFAP